jgi:RHS repeat-associated protein
MIPRPKLQTRSTSRTRRRLRTQLFEVLEPRWMMNSDWRNPSRPLDVNNDMSVSPLDALVVINAINSRGAWSSLGVRSPLNYYLDTNGDNSLSPLDVLSVVNALNDPSRSNELSNQRIDGEAEPGPAGFISIVMGNLPGDRTQLVGLTTQMTLGREEFNEMGLFVVDSSNGSVNGVMPSSPDYASTVFASAQRQVLFSKRDTFRTAGNIVFPAGATLGVYVLQESSDNGDPAKHLRVRDTGTSKVRIGWEEHVSAFPWIGVGDRGYDDAMVDVQFGTPYDGNAEPVITAIPNQSIVEQTELLIQTIAMDADMTDDALVYSLDIAPNGATINPTTGQFRWTPTEAQGPGNFEILIRATDRLGAFDTESFTVTVLESNRAPVLQPITNRQSSPGQSLSFSASASDLDLPGNSLTYSLQTESPVGATINAATGAFAWNIPAGTADGDYAITVRVTDSGSPALFDAKTFTVSVSSDCPFDARLSGWTTFESGGTASTKGTVTSQACSATLREGNSFVVGLERNVVIPSTPSAIEITYQDLNFDPISAGFVRDAFEVALVDADGNSLVQNYIPGRDAFFNATEGLSPAFRSGVTFADGKITIGLGGIPAGTTGRLVARMVNNDSDTQSSVRLSGYRVIASSMAAGAPEGLNETPQLFRKTTHRPNNNTTARQLPPPGPVVVKAGSVFVPPDSVEARPFSASEQFVKSSFSTEGSSNQVMMTPAVIDLNHDEKPEIVFSTYSGSSWTSNGILRSISGVDGKELWSLIDPAHRTVGAASVAVGDVDDDGDIDIFALHDTLRLMKINSNGTVAWLTENPVIALSNFGQQFGGPAIADINQDGNAEIIIGAAVISNDGTVVWNKSFEANGRGDNVFGSLSIVADLNLDGSPEVLAGRNAFSANGDILWQSNISDSFNAIGNFDEDPFPEIAAVSQGSVYLLNHLGEVIWGPIGIPGGGWGGAPTIADFDNDGFPEIGLAGATNYVVIDTNGVVLWQSPVRDTSSSATGSSVFDFDGDGTAEVVYGDETHLRVFAGLDGQILYELLKSSCTTFEYPLIVDVDGDGSTEIVASANTTCGFGSQNGIYVLENKEWVGTRKIWNQHSYHITNINDDGSIPRVEANSWEVYNNYRRNQQPSGTQFGVPIVTASAANSRFAPGEKVLISGNAIAQGKRSDGTANTIEMVTLNGDAPDQLDLSGAFLALVAIQAGRNDFEVVANDAVGQRTTVTLTLWGVNPPTSGIDFTAFTDTTSSFSSVYGRTSFEDDSKTLFVDLATRNSGLFESQTPLLVGVKNISDPTVSLVGIDGFMPDGTPYFNYTNQVPSGRLKPNENSNAPSIAFSNPNRKQFTFDLVFLSQLNQAPAIQTLPKIEAFPGKSYAYDVNASDPDSDTLTYSLLASPAGMAINATTGVITWQPSTANLGTALVSVQVFDGRGGSAIQDYVISVTPAPPNRPPVITSTPVTNFQLLSSQATTQRSRILLSSDINTLSQSANADEQRFVVNAANWLTEGGGRKLLLIESGSDATRNYSPKVLSALREAGFEITVTQNNNQSLEELVAFDAIFTVVVAASLSANSNVVLSDFVRLGRGVYLAGGTRGLSDAQDEAGQWNNFLANFGLAYASRYNGLLGSYPISGSSPILNGVQSLHIGFGNAVVDLDPNDSRNQVIASIQSEPILAVFDGLPEGAIPNTYEYRTRAIDADGDTVNYSLTTSPTGMSIDLAGGQILWRPTADQVGDHRVIVQVSDGLGGMANQEFTICVHPDPSNHAPIIVSRPVTQLADGVYSYDVDAVDADNDEVSYALDQSPNGMSINATTGLISWLPSAQSPTQVDVLVRARDVKGGTDTQSFSVSRATGTSEIRGRKFYDRNGDGQIGGNPLGQNLVENGSFENGLLGVNSDYLHSPHGNTDEGTWWLSPTDSGGAWGPPRSSTNVGRINANGDDSSAASRNRVWWQTVQVQAGKFYDFSAWAWATHAGLDGYQLRFAFNDVQIGNTMSATEARIWEQFNAVYHAAESGPIVISIVNVSGRTFPNDFMFDDISLVEVAEADPGLANWTIYLDQNQNGIQDIGERSTLTDANGAYAFKELPAGTYYVREAPKPGWKQTFPNSSVSRLFDVVGDYSSTTNPAGAWSYGYRPRASLLDPKSFVVMSDSFNRFPNVRFDWSSLISFDGNPSLTHNYDPQNVSQGTISLRTNELTMHPGPNGEYTIARFTALQSGKYTIDAVFKPADALHGTTDANVLLSGSSLFADTVSLNSNANFNRTVDMIVGEVLEFAVGFGPNESYFYDTTGLQLKVGLLNPETGFHLVSLSANQVVNDVDFGNTGTSSTINFQPLFEKPPIATAVADRLYRYAILSSDPDNDPITYSLPVAPTGMTIHPRLGTIAWLPGHDQLGVHSIVVQVSDDQGNSSSQAFEITVSEPNIAPVITSVSPTKASAGRAYQSNLVAQDADGDLLEFTLISGPAGMSIQRNAIRNAEGAITDYSHSLTWTPTTSQVGNQLVKLSVKDGRGGTDTQEFTIATSADPFSTNTPPSILSRPRVSTSIGSPYAYLPTARELDGDPLSWSLTTKLDGMSIEPGTGLITWSPTAQQLGNQRVVLAVSDGHGGIATQDFTIAVSNVLSNSSPIITSNPRTVATEGHEYQYNVVAEDSDYDLIRYTLEFAPRGMSIDSLRGTIRWQPDEEQLGEHQVIVRAADPMGGATTQQFSIDVRCGNLAPAIISIPPTRAVAQRTYLYAVRADDFEQDTLSYRLTDAPAGMTINSTTGVIRWQPTLQQIRSFDVTVEAVDSLGATGKQSYKVVIQSATDPIDPTNPNGPKVGNRPPLITSTPDFTAASGSLYQYPVITTDLDGDAVTLSLTNPPVGMTIDAQGVIRWTPASTTTGQIPISIIATDANGAVSNQAYILDVSVNTPPRITSTAVTSVAAGAIYRYSVKAIDAENDPLTYSLENAPAGMTIDRFGLIRWHSALSDLGARPFTVKVTDNFGQSASQLVPLAVVADTEAPKVAISIVRGGTTNANGMQVDLGGSYVVQVTATDNVAVSSLSLKVAGVVQPLDSAGRATLTAAQLGEVTLEATATDPSNNTGSSTSKVQIVSPATNNFNPNDTALPPRNGGIDPTDRNEPLVKILSPEIGSSVTNITSIVGTVDDPENRLWYWRLFYARADKVSIESYDLTDPDWVLIKQSTSEVVNGELGKFDPTSLARDGYVIALAGYDLNGQGYIDATVIGVEGGLQLGNFQLSFTDLSIPLAGIPITVNRVYDTLNANDEGDFGYGWKLGVQDARIVEIGAIGQGGAQDPGNVQFVPDKTKVYLTNPDGKRVGFTYKEQYQSGAAWLIGCSFGCFYTPSFQPDPGVYDTLTIDATSVTRGGVLGEFSTGINPDQYTLTTKEGTQYRYDQFTGLEKVTDRTGNTVTYSETGVRHSSGTSIDFVRDNRNRIKEILIPANGDQPASKLVYDYDAAGNLVKQTNQVGLSNRYEYLTNPAHFLDKAFDPLGKKSLEVRYENRRYVGVFDGLGNEIGKQEIDVLNNQGIVRDANGNPTTLKYDNRGNVLEEIDPAGNKTIREYKDPRNPDLETRIIDRRGMVTDREYDARGNVTLIAEKGTLASPFAQPIATRFSYNDRNEVTSITNAAGATTSFALNAQGKVTGISNSVGSTAAFTYDTLGRRSSFTDFNGNTTTFDYDGACPCGSPHKAINADGTYQTFEYNRYGQVTKEQTFEANGTLVEQKQSFYDASGRVVREVIGSGNTPLHGPSDVRKFYQGNLLDWEIIVSPESLNTDGSLKESPTTPVAQRKSRITDYEYDTADRLIRQIDAMGGIINFRYDAQGNRVLLQDPVGNITTWTYDTLNRVAEERDPWYWVAYATANASEFAGKSGDAYLDQVVIANRKSSGASLANNQGAAHVRSFGYDAEGNQNEIIDRNNRRREISYDHAGRLLTEMWFAANNGPLVETISFSYDSLGNMRTAQNASSKYTYTYDQLNRLKSVDNEDAIADTPRVILYYEYDAQGNVTKTTDDKGVTVQSTYSKRNQLDTRKWFDADVPSGGTTDVANARVDSSYTAAGRQKQIRRYSDLTATTKVGSTDYTYDQSGRVDTLTHKNAVDTLLSGYDYGYEFSGLLSDEIRDHSNNAYDQSIKYKYDLTGQLVDAAFSGQDDESYVYDANGNRKSSVVGSDARTYMTGPANQLNSDSVYRYEYDGEGNLKFKIRISDGQVTEHFWDHHNMLVKVEERSAGGIVLKTVEYRYDVMGRRIAEIVNGTIMLRAAFDSDHTWGDYNMDGSAETRYLFTDRIDQIIAANRNSEGTVWYNSDKLGTVRELSNATGILGAPAIYSSFGIASHTFPDLSWNRFAFTGRELTATTGEYLYRSRILNTHTGKFLSDDSIGFRALDSNLSRYAFNTPLQFSDPTGNSVVVAYAFLANTALNDGNMAMLGFFSGFSYSTFSFLGYYLASGSRAEAADNLMQDLSVLLLFDWSISTLKTGAGLMGIPSGPLGQIGAFINGFNPSKAQEKRALDALKAEGGAIVELLAKTYTNGKAVDKASKGPQAFKPGFDGKSSGGFINGARWFLSVLK